jgi:chemotaxis protein MotB
MKRSHCMAVTPPGVVLALGLALGSTPGCVSKGRYDLAVQYGRTTHEELEQERAAHAQERAGNEAKEAELTRQLAHATNEVQEREKSLSTMTIEAHNVQAQLDEATAIDQRLRTELERLGKNVDQHLADRGTMSRALEEAKLRLVELRKAQAASEARTALNAQLVAKLKKATEAGPLQLTIRDGRVVVQLPGDVAFEGTRTALRPEGQRALGELAPVLQSVANRKFQVAGHTDNVPPDARTGSNWELSAARAAAVVRFLVARGVAPGALSAAGFGEFSPLYPNDTPQHRAQNRRIEVTLVPGPDDLAGMPGI